MTVTVDCDCDCGLVTVTMTVLPKLPCRLLRKQLSDEEAELIEDRGLASECNKLPAESCINHSRVYNVQC